MDFDDSGMTENTRAAYPIGFIDNHVPEGRAGHPTHIFFLTADASGVLPPLARLTDEQAMYYFLSGYTSKLAGTEKGLGAEPLSTFSTCFGAPFLPLAPGVYARLLGEKLASHRAQVWLVNTGWTGGPFGTGKRMPLPYTRAMVRCAPGALDGVPRRRHFACASRCPEVPDEILDRGDMGYEPPMKWRGRRRNSIELFVTGVIEVRRRAVVGRQAVDPRKSRDFEVVSV
jgi:phosphoenolpyruvate carboxykinase (ATP)